MSVIHWASLLGLVFTLVALILEPARVAVPLLKFDLEN